jgi:hypothetical protein
MSIHEDHVKVYLKSFEAYIESMAWGVVGQIIDEQKKKLASGLVSILSAKNNKKTSLVKTKQITKAMFLRTRKGTWDRGHGAFKLLGPGKAPNTYNLENIKTGKRINTTAKTLLSRWKHFA